MNEDIFDLGEEEIDTHIGKGWIYTFTDLVSILLAFFVLLFSMSTVTKDDWRAVTESLSRSLRPSLNVLDTQIGADLNIAGESRKGAINLNYLSNLLETQMAETDILEGNVVQQIEDRAVVSLPSDLLFKPGSAALSQTGQKALEELGSVLRNIGNVINVYGHTDPMPVETGQFTSNWELSLARAALVGNELRRSGYIKNINAFGAADSHYGHLSPDLSQEQRNQLSRRVDIVVGTTQGEAGGE